MRRPSRVTARLRATHTRATLVVRRDPSPAIGVDQGRRAVSRLTVLPPRRAAVAGLNASPAVAVGRQRKAISRLTAARTLSGLTRLDRMALGQSLWHSVLAVLCSQRLRVVVLGQAESGKRLDLLSLRADKTGIYKRVAIWIEGQRQERLHEMVPFVATSGTAGGRNELRMLGSSVFAVFAQKRKC